MAEDNTLARLAQRLEALFDRADGASGGWLSTLRGAWDSFVLERGAHASAAVAYYAMFSLFPMLLVLVASLSFLVDNATAQLLVFRLIARFLPADSGIATLLTETFTAIYTQRGQVGLIGLAALLWSASGAFTTLSYNIDLAWSKNRRANPYKARLTGLLMIALLYAALLLALALSTVSGALAGLPALLERAGVDARFRWLGSLRAVSVAVTFVAYLVLYRLIPRRHVPWRAAVAPALLAALVSQMVNAGYSWYLRSGFSRYELLYGPLTTIIVLMFWFYLMVLIILVGAHFGAAIARRMDGSVASRP